MASKRLGKANDSTILAVSEGVYDAYMKCQRESHQFVRDAVRRIATRFRVDDGCWGRRCCKGDGSLTNFMTTFTKRYTVKMALDLMRDGHAAGMGGYELTITPRKKKYKFIDKELHARLLAMASPCLDCKWSWFQEE